MKKKAVVFFLTSLLCLSIGMLWGKVDASSNCNTDFSTNCTYNRYMGGKWYRGIGITYNDFSDRASVSSALQRAVSNFNTHPNLSIRRYSGAPDQMMITIHDETHPYDSWVGKAFYSWMGGGFPGPNDLYTRVEIVVNERNSNGVDATRYSSWDLQGLLGHELGHAVGLGHVNNKGALMYCTQSRNVNTLSSYERTVITEIYQ